MNIIFEGNKIVAVWTNELDTLASVYPDNPEMLMKYEESNIPLDVDIVNNPDLYEPIRDNKNEIIGIQKRVVTSKVFTREEKIQGIKTQYQTILDNLISTKLKLEMLGQPIDNIITAYQTKKAEMEKAIRDVV